MFVQTIQHRQGFKIACLEEIALKNKWITKKKLKQVLKNNGYRNEYITYLKTFL